jgi:Raf kinase inhibitor-like YbhB/YbcL family protein
MAQRFFLGDLAITSTAFEAGGAIPDKHTSNGQDVSPPLSWSGAPEGTKAFAVICHDPDAPLMDGYTHWVAYNIPASTTELAEGASGLDEGPNSAGNSVYMGPAPPPGHGVHNYYYWVYALDSDAQIEAGLTRRELIDRIEDHVLEQARLVGTYEN